jgi:hypothetical protein
MNTRSAMNWPHQDQNTDLIVGSNVCPTTYQFFDLLDAQETSFFDKKEKIYVLWRTRIDVTVGNIMRGQVRQTPYY